MFHATRMASKSMQVLQQYCEARSKRRQHDQIRVQLAREALLRSKRQRAWEAFRHAVILSFQQKDKLYCVVLQSERIQRQLVLGNAFEKFKSLMNKHRAEKVYRLKYLIKSWSALSQYLVLRQDKKQFNRDIDELACKKLLSKTLNIIKKYKETKILKKNGENRANNFYASNQEKLRFNIFREIISYAIYKK